MMDSASRSPATQDIFIRFSRGASLTAMGVGLLVLCGYVLDLPVLKSISPSWIALRANTALCFFFTGLALWSRLSGSERPRLAAFGAALPCLLGSLTLLEYLLGANLGIDELFFRQPDPVGSLPPGRMAANTSLNFLLLGISLLLIDRPLLKIRPSEILPILVCVITAPALIGYSYGASFLSGMAAFTQMAFLTAFTMIPLALGVATARPSNGMVSWVTDSHWGGQQARVLLPAVIGAPFFIGWLALWGYRLGHYSIEFGVTLAVVFTLVLLTGLVLGSARSLNMLDRELLAAQSDLERKIEERTLERDRFFTNSIDMLCVAKTDGFFKRLNPAFTEVLGFSEEEMLTKPFLEFVHPDDRDKTIAEVGKLSQGLPTISFENRYLCKDGSYKWLSWKSTPVGDVLYAAARDVTENKQYEAELKTAQQVALDSAKAKSEFLANMSHEIRTPLNGIIGMTDLLIETKLDEQQMRYTRTVQQCGHGLLAVINDILDFSKVEAGKLELEVVDFSVISVVENTVELMAPKAHEKKLSFMSFVEPKLSRALQGDPGRLGQILLNLVGNAIKFTAKGSVTVKVTQTPNGNVLFQVSDTGIGLSESQRQRLFQPFTQADSSTARKFGGTGLGLSISRKLVEIMGGEIGCDAVEGQGSTFWFQIPLKPAENETVATAPGTSEADLSHLRVLIVDDDENSRDILHHYALSWGMRNGRTAEPRTALQVMREEAAKNDPYDVVIIDLVLPESGGLEMAKSIQRDPTINRAKVILATAYDTDINRREVSDAGFSAYLVKPIRQSQLFDTIAIITNRATGTCPLPLPNASNIEQAPTKEERGRSRILIAEDNPVNQMLAQIQLDKLGYSVLTVGNGMEAIDALSKANFDLVLMDCQMPEMDGFEATKNIRKLETATGKHIPIIAMTANAMHGDEEMCLAAGMDDYIAKPIKRERVEQVLARWIIPSKAALDMTVIQELDQFNQEGQPDIIVNVGQIFMRSLDEKLPELKRACTEKNAQVVYRIAHTLKSSSGNVGATGLMAMMAELEAQGRGGNCEASAELFAKAEEEVGKVKNELLELIQLRQAKAAA